MAAIDRRQQLTWNPGLRNGSSRLGDVYRVIPGDLASEVPWPVRALENPDSPIALPGAVDLLTHDCIHLLLGRGLLPQDEAFVLGFTMGTSPHLRPWHVQLFKGCARWVYSGAYRLDRIDLEVFEFALEAARSCNSSALDRVEFSGLMELPLCELRAQLGTPPELLTAIYRRERQRWPNTVASARLLP